MVLGGFPNGRNSLSTSLVVYRLVEFFEISRFLADLVSWASRAVAFYREKGRSTDIYKGKWPRAARKKIIRLFIKGKAVQNTFYKGKWPCAAREKKRLFIKGNGLYKVIS